MSSLTVVYARQLNFARPNLPYSRPCPSLLSVLSTKRLV